MSSGHAASGIKWTRAIVMGALAGGVVIIVMSLLAPLVGVDADLCVPIGGLLGFTVSAAVAGCIAQLVVGAVGGLVYAAVFEYVTQRATWWIGLLVGIGHACLAGIGVAYLFVWRAPPDGIDVPGGFMLFRGAWPAATLVVAHILYGTILGATYGRVRRAPRRAPLAWKEL